MASAKQAMLAPSTHFCDQQHYFQHSSLLTREACCHFVRLLNDTSRIPPCNTATAQPASTRMSEANINFPPTFRTPISLLSNSTLNATDLLLRLRALSTTNSTTPITYLRVPHASEVPQDHVTFLFGVLLMISIAVICAMFIRKLTKPKRHKGHFQLSGVGRTSSSGSSGSNNSAGSSSWWDYDLMVWMPKSYRPTALTLGQPRDGGGQYQRSAVGHSSSGSGRGPLMLLIGATGYCATGDRDRSRRRSRGARSQGTSRSLSKTSLSIVSSTSNPYFPASSNRLIKSASSMPATSNNPTATIKLPTKGVLSPTASTASTQSTLLSAAGVIAPPAYEELELLPLVGTGDRKQQACKNCCQPSTSTSIY